MANAFQELDGLHAQQELEINSAFLKIFLMQTSITQFLQSLHLLQFTLWMKHYNHNGIVYLGDKGKCITLQRKETKQMV